MKNLRNSGRFEMNKKGNIFLAHNRSYIIGRLEKRIIRQLKEVLERE